MFLLWLIFGGPELLELLPLKPMVVKPNREELGKTLGKAIDSEKDLHEAMSRLNELGAQWVVTSQGPDAVWASHIGDLHRFVPPTIDAVNPIGCGDSMAAGIAAGLVDV